MLMMGLGGDGVGWEIKKNRTKTFGRNSPAMTAVRPITLAQQIRVCSIVYVQLDDDSMMHERGDSCVPDLYR